MTPSAPPFFLWRTAEDPYVLPGRTYRLATALAAHDVPHTTHVHPHAPHSLGLARGAGEAATWTRSAGDRIAERTGAAWPGRRIVTRPPVGSTAGIHYTGDPHNSSRTVLR
ncbi:hypothetical protein ACFV2H_28545 [Streptomyces sp. NPDC059629]|uniref:hypothetical protein n=1 Tax=Streptomyces sp. NPDC059629 TaxID=3346889 RepID=UPI0036B02686